MGRTLAAFLRRDLVTDALPGGLLAFSGMTSTRIDPDKAHHRALLQLEIERSGYQLFCWQSTMSLVHELSAIRAPGAGQDAPKGRFSSSLFAPLILCLPVFD